MGIAVMSLALASCQAMTSPEDLVFKSDLFGPGDLVMRTEKVPFGRLQFIVANKGSHQASIVHVEADDEAVIADRYRHSRTFLRTWKELNGIDLQFGEELFLKNTIGEYRYERFDFAGNQCFQFYTIFNHSLYDDQAHEMSILAGYYCNESGAVRSGQEIIDFINDIELNEPKLWNLIPGEDTSDLFAPKHRLFEIRAPQGGDDSWVD